MIQKAALFLFLLISAAIIAILAIAGTRPATFHVERSIQTTASAEAVFPYLNDLHKFPEWSPWQKLDPKMTVEYSGAEAGAGASYHWVGNKDVGEGRMTITDSKPGSHVSMKLEFLKPFESTSDVRLSTFAEAGGTKVTWSMDGNNNYMAKVMSLFMNMDQMIGKDFEAGLANLKRLAESAPAPTAMPADSAATDSSAAAH